MENENTTTCIKDTNKDLYGMLMVVNQRIGNAGTLLFWIVAIPVLALCVSIHMRWFDSIFGVPVEQMRGFGVYALIAVLAFLGFGVVTNYKEKTIYSAAKPAILENLRLNDISVEYLLADRADDKELAQIREKLMDDKDIQQRDPMRLR